MLQVAVFSGGRGSNSIVKELLKDESIQLSLIVNAYDDGKSTGEIRRFFNMLGPSDIRKNQENLMPASFSHHEVWSQIFKFRFSKDAEYASCMEILDNFVEERSDWIEDIHIRDANIKKLIRKLLMQFIVSVRTYEKIIGRPFNFSDCALSNCLYAGAFEITGKSFNETIKLFNILLHTQGDVIPTNLENKKLVAIRENGEICYNEAEIVELRSSDRIKDIFLLDDYLDRDLIESQFTTTEQKNYYLKRIESYVQGTPEAIMALECADIIIYAAGTQHSSLYPSYMTLGISEAIYANKEALKVFVCNIGEDYETPGYAASEFLTSAYKYLTKKTKLKMEMQELIDAALINTSRSTLKDDFRYVENDIENLEMLPVNIVYGNYESAEELGKHDAVRTVEAIRDMYYQRFFEGFADEAS